MTTSVLTLHTLSPETLDYMSNGYNWKLREDVAQYEGTPKEILLRLAKDPIWLVRYRVTLNKNTSVESLIILLKDEIKLIRQAAFKNPNLDF